MARPQVLGAVLTAMLMLAPAAFAAEAIRVEARPGGVVGLGARGVERWAIAHRSLASGRTPDAPVGPAALGTRTFYAVGADLLELDAARGQVIRRTRFPAHIVELAPSAQGQPALLVTIAASGSKTRGGQMTIAFRPDGPRPGRGTWGSYSTSWAMLDARATAPGYNAINAMALAPAAREAAIAAFERAEARDRTNPFLPAFRGRLLAAAGRPDAAARAFAAAAELPAASWPDLLSVSSALEDADAREPARRAFARGLAGMKEAGIRPERVHSLLAARTLLAPPRSKLKQLADAGDVERFDEVASRLATAFPRAEVLDQAWTSVATWMAKRGRPDLAARWTERAAVGKTGLFQHMHQVAAKIDPAIPFLLGLWLATLLLALAAGLRGGAALRRRRDAGAVAGFRRWLPRPRIVDVISALAVFYAALVLSALVAGWIAQLGVHAGTPLALRDDGAAAPEVEEWLTARPLSAGRERWLEYAWQEAKATREGNKYPGAPPDVAAYVDMVEAIPLGERLRGAASAGLGDLFLLAGGPGGVPLLWIAVVAVVLFAGGALTGLALPKVAGYIAWAVPGGPASLSVVGGLVGGLTLAAALTLMGLDRILRNIGTPNYSNIIELPVEPHSLPTPVWAWGVLALCLLVHIVAAWRDRATALRR